MIYVEVQQHNKIGLETKFLSSDINYKKFLRLREKKNCSGIGGRGYNSSDSNCESKVDEGRKGEEGEDKL